MITISVFIRIGDIQVLKINKVMIDTCKNSVIIALMIKVRMYPANGGYENS